MNSSINTPIPLNPPKVLIIRLSSLGDIVQCLASAAAIKEKWPQAKIHWLVRSDFADIVKQVPAVDCVHALDRRLGFGGLLAMIRQLKTEKFDRIYDAHNNVRSFIISLLLAPPWRRLNSQFYLRRSKDRWKRILLFRFHINRFPQPARAILSYLLPLEPWGIASRLPGAPFLKTGTYSPTVQQHREFIQKSIVIAPSAAWATKRWPLGHWQSLIRAMPETHFTVLGGPNDLFCSELAAVSPTRVLNLSGRLSWTETTQVLDLAPLVVSGDTGALHIADALARPTLALIGPTAFGYTSRPTSRVLETELWCKPCSKDGRDRCRNSQYQKCMVDITPEIVAKNARELLNGTI